MNKILIWYLIGDFNDEGRPVLDTDPELERQFRQLEFDVRKPAGAADLLRILRELPLGDTLVHIFAHGYESHFIAPFNQADVNRMRGDGIPINTDAYKVQYVDIRNCLGRIHPAHRLVVNMMAVCNSNLADMPADLFLSFNGLNNDFRESLEVYPLDDNLLSRVNALNARRNSNNGPYFLEIN